MVFIVSSGNTAWLSLWILIFKYLFHQISSNTININNNIYTLNSSVDTAEMFELTNDGEYT